MAEQIQHILLVEDDLAHVELIRRAFRAHPDRFCLTVADSLAQARGYLEAPEARPPQLVIADYLLPDGEGIELLAPDGDGPPFPLVVMTSHGNEQVAVEAMKAGALDYIVKSAGTLSDMPHVAERALREWEHITAHRRAQDEIRRRNRELILLNRVIAASVNETEIEGILAMTCRELALAFELPRATAALLSPDHTAAVVVAEHLADGQTSALKRIIPTAGTASTQEILSHNTPLVVEDAQHDARLAPVRELLQRRGTVSMLVLPLVVDGELVGTVSLDALAPRHFSADEVNLAWSVARQVSVVLARLRLDESRRKLEEQYHQAQKMEAIGRLTGGVAHDFNNILTVILAHCDFILLGIEAKHPLRQDVEQIRLAAERAAGLTRQLLAFSRQQVLQPQILNLNETVLNIEKMLRRLLGEDIILTTRLAQQIGPVLADPGQIEQVIMNLAVNARDAMPHGGKLIIETDNVHLDEKFAREHANVIAGPYVMLAISDTGVGIDAETSTHIFEPFFTTKAHEKGTGLGLATVHGIISQSGGHIWVYSEPGRGTTFKIFLPLSAKAAEQPGPRVIATTPERGSATILLVEDEEMVRELTRRTLVKHGYTVLVAENGAQALRVCAEHAGPIHLLLTDVIMPGGMTGPQLSAALERLYPQMKLLYMSGYTDEAIVQNSLLDPHVPFLPKPFAPSDLLRKISEVMGS